jgi:hypothetical protein
MAEGSQIPTQILKEVALFMKQSNVGRLSRNLRGLLLAALMAQKDGYCFDMDDLLVDLSYLFELLDAMEGV